MVNRRLFGKWIATRVEIKLNGGLLGVLRWNDLLKAWLWEILDHAGNVVQDHGGNYLRGQEVTRKRARLRLLARAPGRPCPSCSSRDPNPACLDCALEVTS